MSKVKFHEMRMDFQALKILMNTASFDGLIFQPILEDVDASKEDFILICYETYAPGTPPRLSTMNFVKFGSTPLPSKKKVMFGNLPLKRSTIQAFINDTPSASFLYFKPKSDNDYIQYHLTTDDTQKAAFSYDLKPAPPAS